MSDWEGGGRQGPEVLLAIHGLDIYDSNIPQAGGRGRQDNNNLA